MALYYHNNDTLTSLHTGGKSEEIQIDDAFDIESENALQNKVITTALNRIPNGKIIDWETEFTERYPGQSNETSPTGQVAFYFSNEREDFLNIEEAQRILDSLPYDLNNRTFKFVFYNVHEDYSYTLNIPSLLEHINGEIELMSFKNNSINITSPDKKITILGNNFTFNMHNITSDSCIVINERANNCLLHLSNVTLNADSVRISALIECSGNNRVFLESGVVLNTYYGGISVNNFGRICGNCTINLIQETNGYPFGLYIGKGCIGTFSNLTFTGPFDYNYSVSSEGLLYINKVQQ